MKRNCIVKNLYVDQNSEIIEMIYYHYKVRLINENEFKNVLGTMIKILKDKLIF